MTRPAAASFARTVTNIANYPEGLETHFGLGTAFIETWRPAADTWVFTLVEVDDDFEMTQHGTVSIVPAEHTGYEVLTGDGTVMLADFRGIEAAIGFALDEVAAPEWRKAIHLHDPVAV